MHNRPSHRTDLHVAARSPKLRIAAAVLTAVSLGLAGCGKGNSPTAPTVPTASTPGVPILYAALGASDVVGFGSSRVCLPFEDCDGTGYVWVAARSLRAQGFTVTIASRGIPSAVLSPTFQTLAAQYGRPVPGGNIVDSQMPFVPRESTLVTIFAGPNDVNTLTDALGNGAGGSDPAGFIDQKVVAFAADYATLLDGVRSRAPRARIIVLNVPNLAGAPYLAAASLLQKQAAQRASVRMTAAINTLPSVSVIDLMCDRRFYQPSVFSSDGFHPNDAGYAIVGAELARAVTSSSYPAPAGSCPQMMLY
jgi:lysophospholipase L1-like esterase